MQKVHAPTALCFGLVFWHKQPHTQVGTIVFALWSTLPHYSGRAVALFCKVISCCITDASGSLQLIAHPGGSSFTCATLQRFSSGLICWAFCVLCDFGVTLTSHHPLHLNGEHMASCLSMTHTSSRLYKESRIFLVRGRGANSISSRPGTTSSLEKVCFQDTCQH